ncbi:toxin-activating lysine-acyltransferase, partial [Bartonella sp. MM73XJBT]|uniref:toxin-activating lysine-acyltransferase n=1 Tax=Bartonella sp. MM73XJBT TaxID=3019095 RepID=UPI00235DC843
GLKAKLDSCQYRLDHLSLYAPVDGRIDDLSIHTLGGFVEAGKYMWFINFVAPHSHAARIVRDMQRHVFPDQKYWYAVRRNEDGGIRKITRWCCYREQSPSK